MNKYLYTILGILLLCTTAHAQFAPYTVGQGGIGWNAVQANTVMLGNGTGKIATTTAGTNGFILALVGGVPTFVASSSINNGVASLAQTGGGTAQTGAITLATSSDPFNGLQANEIITNVNGAFTFSNNITGTLTVAGGGTGQSTFTSSQLLYGNGTNGISSVGTTSETCSAPLSCTAFGVVGSGGGAITFSNLTVANGGTGATTFTQGWLYSLGGTGAIAASTTPTVNAITSTSTTATSTFAGPVNAKVVLTPENIPATSTSMTIDWGTSNQQLVRMGSAAMTITLAGTTTPGESIRLLVCNPNSSAGALTFAPAAQIRWPSATIPTQTTTANKCDVWSFLYTQATSTSVIFGSQSANF